MKPPPYSLALSDAPRALVDGAVLTMFYPLLKKLPRASGPHSVMVIPGFLGNDRGNGPLIRFLRELGYHASGWRQGQNLGTASFSEESLAETLAELAAKGGGKVSLVGHSLGGIYAREIARMEPDVIRQVITLGSPFAPGHEEASHASRFYHRLNPREQREVTNPNPPPVPTTAIYTKGDGVVNWRTSLQRGEGHHVHNIRVFGSHIGLNINAAVWYWVAKKLAAH